MPEPAVNASSQVRALRRFSASSHMDGHGGQPIPSFVGPEHKHRLSRGGHRQADAALYRAVIVRMRFHEPTIAYGVAVSSLSSMSQSQGCEPPRPEVPA